MWCCIRDFNELLSQSEKRGIRPFHSDRAQLFRDFLCTSRLMDLDLKGCSITWTSNPRNGEVVKEKLDRVLENLPWRMSFQNALAVALPAVSSDHSPILLNLEPKTKSGRMFNFEVFWAEHEECEVVVQNGWQNGTRDEDVWENVHNRTHICKQELQQW